MIQNPKETKMKSLKRFIEPIFTIFSIAIFFFEAYWVFWMLENWEFLQITSAIGNIAGMLILPVAGFIAFCEIFGFCKRTKRQKFENYEDISQK